MIFISLEGSFSQSKSIRNHFQVEVAMKCAPRRPRDVSRRPQDAPKTLPRRPKAPKTAPGRPQDGPKTPPGRSKTPPRSGKNRAQKRIFSGPPRNLDFGASWGRFWRVLAPILGVFLGGFKELKTHKTQKELGGFDINFVRCFGWL